MNTLIIYAITNACGFIAPIIISTIISEATKKGISNAGSYINAQPSRAALIASTEIFPLFEGFHESVREISLFPKKGTYLWRARTGVSVGEHFHPINSFDELFVFTVQIGSANRKGLGSFSISYIFSRNVTIRDYIQEPPSYPINETVQPHQNIFVIRPDELPAGQSLTMHFLVCVTSLPSGNPGKFKFCIKGFLLGPQKKEITIQVFKPQPITPERKPDTIRWAMWAWMANVAFFIWFFFFSGR